MGWNFIGRTLKFILSLCPNWLLQLVKLRLNYTSIFLCAFAKLRKATISLVMPLLPPSFRMEQLCSQWKDFDEILYLNFFFENMSKKFKFDKNVTRIKGTLHECFFLLCLYHRILFRIRNFSDKSCTENQNTHFTFSKFFFPKIVAFMR